MDWLTQVHFKNTRQTHTHTHTHVLLLFWILSVTTRVSRYQKGKTNLDLLEQEIVSGSGISWAYATLTPFHLLQGIPLRSDTWVHLIPHSTHPQSSSLHGAVKAGSLSEIDELYLLPASRASIFNPLDHRELRLHCCHQCSHRPDCTSSQVGCVPSQPDRLVTQSIATLILSRGELTV